MRVLYNSKILQLEKGDHIEIRFENSTIDGDVVILSNIPKTYFPQFPCASYVDIYKLG